MSDTEEIFDRVLGEVPTATKSVMSRTMDRLLDTHGPIADAIRVIAPTELRDDRLAAEMAIKSFVVVAIAEAGTRLSKPTSLQDLVEEVRRAHFPDMAPVSLAELPRSGPNG
jgi:hypothetical protein